ncbi:putative amidase [Nemania abortiva]|nr:putative amidase [Nemania abortiva]
MANSIVRILPTGSYFVHPQEVGRLVDTAASSESWTPAVLLSVQDPGFGLEHAQKALDDFSRRDDVFSVDFSSTLILQSGQDVNIFGVAARLVESGIFRTIYISEQDHKHTSLPSGPYFIQGQSIHQAWKLYDDDFDAFVIPTIVDDVFNPESFSVLQAVSQKGSFRSIAVPSRLYSSPSKEKPLAGARVGIKDNYDLKGIRTTMMNRAYNELYPPRTSTADYAAKLIELGAVIVGKTKMSAFASAEEPTDQWIDYHCPFNPRGDQYQTPSCSSTGAGASLAGYSWLDHSIGSDTSGSIRLPAAFNGLFGLRTSYGIASRRGIVPSCNEFDTVGTLHRSLKDAKHLITATLDVPDSSQFPKRLIYPLDFFPQEDAEQQAMTEAFISIVEKFLGVERAPISITDTWASNPPKEAGTKTLQEFLEMSAVWPMYYDTYHTFDNFRQDYLAKYGKPPFVGPYMRKRWSIAVPFKKEERAQGVAEMKVFRTWFENKIMGQDSDTVTNAVMIMPFGAATPKYRDDTNKLPSVVGSFSVFYLPAVLQLPTLIIPIGQKPYDSRISGQKEYLPIVSSFMGAKGSDVMLINLADAALKSAKWPTEVKTGREAFVIGDNVCNVMRGNTE